MKLGIIIQARMGSTRLPGKVLRLIAGLPLLGHVLGRLKMLHHSAVVVVATSTLAQDDVIESWCKLEKVTCFRGDELDVLNRYVRCSANFAFQQVVRLTADNPFTDIAELDRLIDLHYSGGFDYSHSFGIMPLGVGAEIFTMDALLRTHAEGLCTHHREHVNEYIQENQDNFKIGVLEIDVSKRAPGLRLTVDTEDDWLRACVLAEQASGRWVDTEEAISLCLRFA